ncbi:precorrin-2 dehydrogenase/sirohydrochlorin ferrochelatase family protein [Paradesulfitobacterium ferrireducens]|uniref:precorrin-2 dehydrogenase/sirohydrochlorin ferrochelatase family protein n=1 Tax=Paradesulfitobacterium ferrireducens TaxID=2816476 RepID=UPI001A8EDCF1|nr:NAD(P)-dependent oxidoreductase [Paradesulfitobacterium ferrireducens]
MGQYYPIFLDLKDKPVLVIGGGSVALRKVQTLLAHEARVHVVAPEINKELRELIDGKLCLWSSKAYDSQDIKDAVLIFSCTDQEEVNAQVARDAALACRPVNVVDDPEKCSFIVPSILERGDLAIAVSTGGSSPIVARQIRMELEEMYGDEMKDYLALLKSWRPRVKESLSPAKRRLFWERVTDGQVRSIIKSKRLLEAKGVVEACFRSLLD